MITYAPHCPECQRSHRQVKAGRAVNGNQRYKCQDCKRTYVQENRRFRFPSELRAKAVEMFQAGLSYRQIGRLLDVNHQTVASWLPRKCTSRCFRKADDLFDTQPKRDTNL